MPRKFKMLLDYTIQNNENRIIDKPLCRFYTVPLNERLPTYAAYIKDVLILWKTSYSALTQPYPSFC